jgi:hypothetical protein
MGAVRLKRGQSPPQLCDVPQPAAGPDEVLLCVDAAGLCHSDLHLMHWAPARCPTSCRSRWATRSWVPWSSSGLVRTGSLWTTPSSSTGRGATASAAAAPGRGAAV